MTLVIGLTGGIASGKSTVSNMLKDRGITVIDADVEARLAVEKGEEAYKAIVHHFGSEILLPDGSINRSKLGAIIFSDQRKRKVLNDIVHPVVRKKMLQKKEQSIQQGESIVILDIPLLFESGLTNLVDKTILVYVDEEKQIERLMNRNHFSKEEALARIHSQFSLKEKRTLADAVIDNNGSVENTNLQLLRILNGWKEL
ncbi:dephospho-CoA kinase [Bacillus sp. 03113]|uniref:dephospho-CoA kinase n=1 Tax=Bacillus sp. 03113 TaxID=2578211 RepID=UPI0011448A9C|nr:dephospho-CoA kinase [Bacillus sp. 03113]